MTLSTQFISCMPQGRCLLWRPELMLLHVASDAVIALAYFAITLAILGFVRGRDDLEGRHRARALLVGGFIASCGLMHVASIIVLWLPVYVLEGWLKAAAAMLSLATAIMLIALVPKLLKLPSLKQLQTEIVAHRATMVALDATRASLALKVARTEQELRETEHHWHESATLLGTVIKAMPGFIYAKDRSGKIILANKAALDLIGKEWADVYGKCDNEFWSDRAYADAVMANDQLVMAAGQPQELEEVVTHPEKGQRILLSTRVPFGKENDPVGGLVGISIDITERKQLARELVHVSRRSAMGEMATAIAHEINQPLAAVTMYIGGSLMLLGDDPANDRVTRSLAVAKAQSLRAGEIIRGLRSFVSGGDDVKRWDDMVCIVNAACAISLLGAKEDGVTATIKHDFPEMSVLVERIQIEQVVVNLVRNAIDSLKAREGAMVWVTTGLNADGMAMLTVRDNGPGVSPEVAPRLFRPFVSTKGVKGMGVGLSICRTIVEAHGGKIWVEPDDGTGATFRVTLPTVERGLAT